MAKEDEKPKDLPHNYVTFPMKSEVPLRVCFGSKY